MKKIENLNFFKENSSPDQMKSQSELSHTFVKETVGSHTKTIGMMKLATVALTEAGFDHFAKRIEQICQDVNNERFVVSVVGEFSRGKSSFINKLIGMDVLPVGNLPTTALLTRIRFSPHDRIVHYNNQGTLLSQRALSEAVWKGLIADSSGKEDPEGCVVVSLNNEWLGNHSIEIVDSPGAGDLNEKRAKQIGDILLRSDGCIITVSALQALSMTEKVFIEQRVLTRRKTPFLMLILTKLDMVKKEERNGVIRLVKEKLAHWKMDIPVFIPDAIELPDVTFQGSCGLDKVKTAIESWVKDPNRCLLTEKWMKARTAEILAMAMASLHDKVALLDVDDDKRKRLILQKKQALEHVGLVWGDLGLELQRKSNACYNQFLQKVEEYKREMIEKLQYEVSHTASPKKWWTEDYPYRLKVELANMAIGLESIITKIASLDARWFNSALEEHFKMMVTISPVSVARKEEFTQFQSTKRMEFEDLNKKMNMTRVGTVALSIAGALVLTTTGFGILSLVATMGLGTGASILSANFFKNKIEAQRNELKKVIAKDIPAIVEEAICSSEGRVKALYDDMLKEAEKKEYVWVVSQNQIFEEGLKPTTTAQRELLQKQIEKIHDLLPSFTSNIY